VGSTFSITTTLAQILEECQGKPPEEAIVINLSINGAPSLTVDNLLKTILSTCHAAIVAAAGNSAIDACNTSPARVPGILTVGASTGLDVIADFSNHGSCVDLYAPGKKVTAAWASGDAAAVYIDGTSFSAPLTAGAVALVLEQFYPYPNASVNQGVLAMNVIKTWATPSMIKSTFAVPQPLLYTLINATAENNYGINGPPLVPTPSAIPPPPRTPTPTLTTVHTTPTSAATTSSSTSSSSVSSPSSNSTHSTHNTPSPTHSPSTTKTPRSTRQHAPVTSSISQIAQIGALTSGASSKRWDMLVALAVVLFNMQG
jgi:subtilisin family serine protease